MQGICVNPEEANEVVYFCGSKMTERQIENRIAPLREGMRSLQEDLDAVKRTVSGLATPGSLAAPKPNWLQRNPWAATVIGALIGAGLFGFSLPRIIDHITGDLDSRIDRRSDQKFTDHHFDALRDSVQHMEGEVKTLDDDVKLLLAKSIKQAADLSTPELKRQLPQINNVLEAAARSQAPGQLKVLDDLRIKLTPLVRAHDEEAWTTTLSLASYRSLFNPNPYQGVDVRPIVAIRPRISRYLTLPATGEQMAEMSAPQTAVNKDIGARFEPIGQDLNPTASQTNPFIILQGGSAVLDGFEIRNVVFIGVHIVYDGGPLTLEHSVFINCRFSITNTERGRNLVETSLTSPTITFATAS
jgi:hypothetical protein